MHWMRGCKEIIPSIDAQTTSLIYVAAKNIREDDDRDAESGRYMGMAILSNAVLIFGPWVDTITITICH